MKILRALLLFAGVAVVAAACSDSDSGGSDDAARSETTTSLGEPGFAGQVLPVIEENCARCHTGDGPGTPHLRMDTVGDVLANADVIEAAVRGGAMPPWPASSNSVEFRDNWNLTDRERSAIVSWASFEPSVNIAEDTPIVSTAGVRRLEGGLTIAPEVGYDGVAFQPDEYRCFIYDPGFTTETWLRGYEFVPDQTEVVHHAIGYLIDADLRDLAEAVDAEHADNGGWPCFGSSGLGADEIFLGWAPGQGPTELPEGSGMRVGPGDFMVVQVHYHFEVDAPEDFSTLELDLVEDSGDLDEVDIIEFVAPAEIPCFEDEDGPLCDRDAALADAIAKYGREGVQANGMLAICRRDLEEVAVLRDGIASSSCDLPARTTGTIISVLGHEHELGASFKMTLNPDSDDERVLLDIPEWDFDWQLNYYPVEQIQLRPGDVVRIECSWNRNLRDPALEPAWVLWADGTNDEMCFSTMLVRESA